MATIKIDRGFTQKTQQKTYSYKPGPAVPPQAPQKKRRGGPSGLTLALIGVGALLLVAVVGIVVAVIVSGKEDSPKPAPAARPVAAQPAAPQPAVAQPAAAAPAAAPAPAPEAKVVAKPRSAPPVIHAKVRTGFSASGTDFSFDGVPRPSANDAASSARFALVDTEMDRRSGGPTVLNDGRVPTGVDQPKNCFLFKKGSGGGRLLLDLGRTVAVRQVNTYSWHTGKQGPQVYTLYGGDDESPEFVVDPGRSVDPVPLGWRRLADVDTRPQSGSWAGQYGASVSAETGTLGSYRFLFFVVHAVGSGDENENTCFCEIDVVDSGSTATPVAAEAADSSPVFGDREVPLGSPQGLLCEFYDHISGNVVEDIRKSSKFPSQPDWVLQAKRFELPEKQGEQYGARVRGYVVPPQSGSYTFVLNVDDGGEFWLSTDDSPAHLRRLVALTKHTNKKWDAFPEQRSEPCELVAGQRYYLEAFLKQASGGDYLAVSWQGPAVDKLTIIDGKFLLPWKDGAN